MPSSVQDQPALKLIPAHVGIIMDGNGRWASRQGKPRTTGHEEGLKAAKRIAEAASKLGIKYISLFTFSTENWKRAEEEISFLMFLIKKHLRNEYDFYREHRIRVVHCGDLVRLPKDVQAEITAVEKDTSDFKGLTLNLAINYGGRDEIVRAVNRWLTEQKNHKLETRDNYISENDIFRHLDQPGIPEPDMIIRTGSELRISNFLLWETAYSELYFSEELWPDWGEEQLIKALNSFQDRNRRYGGY